MNILSGFLFHTRRKSELLTGDNFFAKPAQKQLGLETRCPSREIENIFSYPIVPGSARE
jgi:hypothetical protein